MSAQGTGYKPLSEEIAERGEEDPSSSDLPMTGLMGESMEDYCSSFENEVADNDRDSADSEQHDDTDWSNPWSSQTDQSQEWTPEEAAYWSSEPEGADPAPDALAPGTQTVPEEEEEEGQDEEDQAQEIVLQDFAGVSQGSRASPARARRPAPHRRSTVDGGKTEIELQDQFRCMLLSHLISVGGD